MPPIRTSFNVIPGNPYPVNEYPQGLPLGQNTFDPNYGVTPDQQKYIMNTSGNYWVGKQNIENQKAANAQYMYELAKNANNTSIFNAATGQNISGPIDFKDAQSYVNDIRENNQNANTNAWLNGSPLQVDPYGKIDPSLIQGYKTRQGVVSDTNKTLGVLPNYVTGQYPGFNGFNGGSVGQGIVNQMNPPTKDGKYSIPTLDPGIDGQSAISTGVGQVSWGNQDPYSIGVPSIPELNTARNNEQSNANTLYGHQVTNAHNVRSDATKNRELNAQIQGLGYFHKYPPVGPAGQTPINQANTVSQMLDRQLKAVENQMESEGFVEKNKIFGTKIKAPTDTTVAAKDWFGNPVQYSAQDQAKFNRFQQLNNTRQQLLQQLSGVPMGNLPFGGQSMTNLQNSSSGFAKWKSGKK